MTDLWRHFFLVIPLKGYKGTVRVLFTIKIDDIEFPLKK